MARVSKIVSGGQTGVDRAALDLCLELGIPCGGWCPKGRLAEDGMIAEVYPLSETPEADVSQRTEWNVRDSDGTLILSKGKPADGTPLTEECAIKYTRPLLSLDLTDTPDIPSFLSWLEEYNIKVLNIAGPRESHDPGYVYERAYVFLKVFLEKLKSVDC